MYLSKWSVSSKDYCAQKFFNRYEIHKFVCRIHDAKSVKFSVEENQRTNSYTILIQCETEVKEIPTFGTFQTKILDVSKINSGKYRICVDLNAITQTTEFGKNPKKIPIVGQGNISNWIHNKKFGGEVSNVIVSSTFDTIIKKSSNVISCKWHKVTVDVDVKDEITFRNILNDGLGSQKSFGFGMVKIFKI